jgi:hypothetical protein
MIDGRVAPSYTHVVLAAGPRVGRFASRASPAPWTASASRSAGWANTAAPRRCRGGRHALPATGPRQPPPSANCPRLRLGAAGGSACRAVGGAPAGLAAVAVPGGGAGDAEQVAGLRPGAALGAGGGDGAGQDVLDLALQAGEQARRRGRRASRGGVGRRGRPTLGRGRRRRPGRRVGRCGVCGRSRPWPYRFRYGWAVAPSRRCRFGMPSAVSLPMQLGGSRLGVRHRASHIAADTAPTRSRPPRPRLRTQADHAA